MEEFFFYILQPSKYRVVSHDRLLLLYQFPHYNLRITTEQGDKRGVDNTYLPLIYFLFYFLYFKHTSCSAMCLCPKYPITINNEKPNSMLMLFLLWFYSGTRKHASTMSTYMQLFCHLTEPSQATNVLLVEQLLACVKS